MIMAITITIDDRLLEAIDKYNSGSEDYTTIGKLNLVAFVGKAVCAIVKEKIKRRNHEGR